MKKLFKLFALLLVCLAVTFTIACEKEVTVDSISVVESTIPESILTTEIDSKIGEIKIDVKKSDDTTEQISLSKNMISEEDYAKLATEGNHEIKVKYEGKELTDGRRSHHEKRGRWQGVLLWRGAKEG